MITKIYGYRYTVEPYTIGENESRMIDLLQDRIAKTSKYNVNLIINLTWLNVSEEKELLDWIDAHRDPSSTKIYLTAFVDGAHWFTMQPLYAKIINLGHETVIEGFHHDNWYSWIPNWMQEYSQEQVKLNANPKWAYLCYNRKPRYHRQKLVEKILANNLFESGWITYEKGHYPEIDQLSGSTDNEIHSPDLKFSRPEDLQSIGNLDIWNNSYCVIVSETEPNDPWHISEKTWKPIIGMRPFLFNGNKNICQLLKSLGFHTPGDFFDDHELDNCKIESIIEHLKMLSKKTPEELYLMWENKKQMLMENKERFDFLKINKQYFR